MKIEKAKLSKALKQISIFINKNNIEQSLVHFRNENKKAMMFATDKASAGRTYFDTDEDEVFEFCIEYDQLLQTVRARGNELTATIYTDKLTESGEKMSGIEFTDGKSKFDWALHSNDTNKAQESVSVVPTDVPYFEIDAKTLKNAIKAAGFARNEKETQTVSLTGVNFIGCGSDLTMVSTDRHRVAGWKKSTSETLEGMPASTTVNGVLASKSIASIGQYDDDDTIRVYISDKQIILVSDNLETYAEKIQYPFPDLQKMFDKEEVSTYKLSAKALKESIEIVLGKDDTIKMSFKEDSVTVSSKRVSGDGTTDDTFPCERVSGKDHDILVNPNDILDIVKNSTEDGMTISFRPMKGDFYMLSYKIDDGAYGIVAPKKNN